MSLRDFLDAAYTLLLREVRTRYATLEEALEAMAPLAARTLDHTGLAEQRADDLAERRRLRQEEQSMKQIEGMLARAGAPAIR